jgi:putative transposase
LGFRPPRTVVYRVGTARRQPYPSDLTALQWANIEHLFPQPRGRAGRKRTYDRKDIVDAIFYLARTGAAWRMLPHDFPPWKTVSDYFYTWRDAGVWEALHATLRRDVRRLLDREDTPSAGIVGSQSVKTTEAGGPKGYDGGKKGRRPQAAPAG